MKQPHSKVSPPRLADLVALAQSTPHGCFVEVGVYQGGSACHLYQLACRQSRTLHLFDTFTGMPYHDDGDFFKTGDFNLTSAAAVQELMPAALLFPGVFPASLTEETGQVAFAHFDCDQYRSTADGVKALLPRMKTGSIMAFDDYPTFPGIVRAVEELFGRMSVQYTPHRFAYVEL